MTPRAKKPPPPGSLDGRKAKVSVERGGACIVVEDIPAAEAGLVLADILAAFRVLARKFPELREVPEVVPGGHPIDVTDDDYADEGRGLGFRVEG